MAEQEPSTGPGSNIPGTSNPGKPKEIKHAPVFANMGLDPN